MAQRVSARLSRAAGRRFGLTVGIAFLLLGGATWWRLPGFRTASGDAAAWSLPLVLAAVLALTGALLVTAAIIMPTRLGRIERAWMKLAHATSRITTPIVMGGVYFLVITPIGAVMRLLGRTPIVHRSRGGSYWITREQRTSDMRRQF